MSWVFLAPVWTFLWCEGGLRVWRSRRRELRLVEGGSQQIYRLGWTPFQVGGEHWTGWERGRGGTFSIEDILLYSYTPITTFRYCVCCTGPPLHTRRVLSTARPQTFLIPDIFWVASHTNSRNQRNCNSGTPNFPSILFFKQAQVQGWPGYRN